MVGRELASLIEASMWRVRMGQRRVDTVERTDINWRLVLAGLACLVCDVERGPVQGSIKRTIAKGADLDFIARRALSKGQAVHASGRSRRSKEECLEKHD